MNNVGLYNTVNNRYLMDNLILFTQLIPLNGNSSTNDIHIAKVI